MPTKTCRTCQQTLPVAQFYKAKEYKGVVYRFPDCKACTCAAERRRYRRNGRRKAEPARPEKAAPRLSTDWLRRLLT